MGEAKRRRMSDPTFGSEQGSPCRFVRQHFPFSTYNGVQSSCVIEPINKEVWGVTLKISETILGQFPLSVWKKRTVAVEYATRVRSFVRGRVFYPKTDLWMAKLVSRTLFLELGQGDYTQTSHAPFFFC